MSNPLLNTVDLDDVLAKFKVYGRYHAATAVWITLIILSEAIVSTNYVFVAEEVRYSCADNEPLTNISGTLLHNTSNSENTIELCRSPEMCTQWVYDNPNSFVAEFQLACQDWKRTLVGTVHSFGTMAGLVIVGPLSDKFGRKPLIIITVLACGVFGLAKSFTSIYWFYIVLEFLEAALGDPYSPLYTISVEMVSTNSRVKYTTICNLGFPIGGILFPLMCWLVPYWRTFLRMLYVPTLLFIFVTYWIDESPRWLLSKGNTIAAVKIIEKAAKMNKITIEENLAMISFQKDASSNFKTAIADTFRSRSLLKSFFACLVWWTASVFVNYGVSINSVSLAGNKYINYALSSAVELPSYVIVGYVMDKFNRKLPLIFTFTACAVLCAGQPFIPKNLSWLSISIYMMIKLIANMFFSITYMFTAELFPTYTRNSMQALCSAVGRIGGIAAPLTPLLMIYWSGLPTMLFGAVSLIGALATFLVPDTGEKSLPDTVLEAEALGDTNTRVHFEESRTSTPRARDGCTYL